MFLLGIRSQGPVTCLGHPPILFGTCTHKCDIVIDFLSRVELAHFFTGEPLDKVSHVGRAALFCLIDPVFKVFSAGLPNKPFAKPQMQIARCIVQVRSRSLKSILILESLIVVLSRQIVSCFGEGVSRAQ